MRSSAPSRPGSIQAFFSPTPGVAAFSAEVTGGIGGAASDKCPVMTFRERRPDRTAVKPDVSENHYHLLPLSAPDYHLPDSSERPRTANVPL